MSQTNASGESSSRRRTRRSIVATAGAVTAAVLLAAPATAAQPNHPACLGKDLSAYAEGGAAFGTFVSGMATTTGGVGAEIQAHLAGAIPDAMQPNSCND